MKRFVPSLSSLRAFEAAARHGSFTRAANELGITQTAVSHQVKNLENQLGVRLFLRHRNTLRLTDAAHNFLASVRSAIQNLAEATEHLVQTEHDEVLTINSLATFSFKCLIPRLAEFRGRHPEIALRTAASASFDDFNRKACDVAIGLGGGSWPGMRKDRIFTEWVFPVCSPVLLSGPHPLREPADLVHHVIIRNGFSFLVADPWPKWLDAAGVSEFDVQTTVTFEYPYAALEAAIHGLGVALGREPFVHEDLKAGRLVRPFDLSVATDVAYYVVSPLEVASRRKVRIFREWLLETFAEDPE